uniref:Uncharacterized protein n=1 Tax=Ralstonia solanacearum TaxID=305 RepID=A0A0S4WUR4_RALSL|nr:protein of unknown function [Ralstonia solanacearum]
MSEQDVGPRIGKGSQKDVYSLKNDPNEWSATAIRQPQRCAGPTRWSTISRSWSSHSATCTSATRGPSPSATRKACRHGESAA